MCKYCEHNRPLLISDNESELEECCNIAYGAHKRVEVRIVGQSLKIRHTEVNRTPKDCYYMACLEECAHDDDIPDMTKRSSTCNEVQLNFCPMCGRKLTLEDVDSLAGAQTIKNQ